MVVAGKGEERQKREGEKVVSVLDKIAPHFIFKNKIAHYN